MAINSFNSVLTVVNVSCMTKWKNSFTCTSVDNTVVGTKDKFQELGHGPCNYTLQINFKSAFGIINERILSHHDIDEDFSEPCQLCSEVETMASEERLRNNLGEANGHIALVRRKSDAEATKIKKGYMMGNIERVTSCRGLRGAQYGTRHFQRCIKDKSLALCSKS